MYNSNIRYIVNNIFNSIRDNIDILDINNNIDSNIYYNIYKYNNYLIITKIYPKGTTLHIKEVDLSDYSLDEEIYKEYETNVYSYQRYIKNK